MSEVRGSSAAVSRRAKGGGTLGAVTVLAAVFIAGAGAGVAIDRYLIGHRSPEPDKTAEGPRVPERARIDPATRRVLESGIPFHIERLGLTPDQEQTLSAIARRRRPEADSIMRTLRPITRHIETEMMQEMLCALTPAQQTHWLAYMDTVKFDPEVAAERYRPIKTHTCGATRPSR